MFGDRTGPMRSGWGPVAGGLVTRPTTGHCHSTPKPLLWVRHSSALRFWRNNDVLVLVVLLVVVLAGLFWYGKGWVW